VYEDQACNLLCTSAILNLADCATTVLALEKGGEELNPVMRKVIDNFGLMGFAIVKGVVSMVQFGLAQWVLRKPQENYYIVLLPLFVMDYFLFLAVLNNILVYFTVA